MKNKMKVALFGGSFNPFHKMHLLIVKRILAEKFVDEVWIIPCKIHAFDKELIGSDKRTEMISLATGNLDKVKINPIEIEKDNISFTSETIKTLKEKYEHDFYFVIGEDNLENIESWNDFNYIKNNVNFILTRRGNYNYEDAIKINIHKELSSAPNISSTIIRNRLKKNLPIDDLVPIKVANYIQERGLYK